MHVYLLVKLPQGPVHTPIKHVPASLHTSNIKISQHNLKTRCAGHQSARTYVSSQFNALSRCVVVLSHTQPVRGVDLLVIYADAESLKVVCPCRICSLHLDSGSSNSLCGCFQLVACWMRFEQRYWLFR